MAAPTPAAARGRAAAHAPRPQRAAALAGEQPGGEPVVARPVPRLGLHVVPRAAWGEVQLLRQVGSGATADVYEGEWRGQRVAVKRFLYRCEEFTREEVERFRNEAAVLERLRHAALCPAGTLADALRARADAGRRFTAGEAAAVGAAVARALAYLHSRQPRVVHRDVKPANVLLGADGEWRLADFGSATHLQTAAGRGPAGARAVSVKRRMGDEGSFFYLAPEVIRDEPADEKVDVYSLGMLLYEAATGRRPFEGSGLAPMAASLAAATEGLRPALPEEGPAAAWRP
eukprot:tig00001065_g6705.t1